MYLKKIILIGFAANFSLTMPVFALDVSGVWNAADGDAKVRVSPCEGGLCAQIISLKEPNDPDTGKPATDKNNPDEAKRKRPVVGLSLFQNMKPAGDSAWKGKIYSPDNGKSYESTVTVDGNTLIVKGCVLGGLICDKDVWTR